MRTRKIIERINATHFAQWQCYRFEMVSKCCNSNGNVTPNSIDTGFYFPVQVFCCSLYLINITVPFFFCGDCPATWYSQYQMYTPPTAGTPFNLPSQPR